MGFVDTLNQYLNGLTGARPHARKDDQADLQLPLDESSTRGAVAFRVASSAPFGTWWSGSPAA